MRYAGSGRTKAEQAAIASLILGGGVLGAKGGYDSMQYLAGSDSPWIGALGIPLAETTIPLAVLKSLANGGEPIGPPPQE